jgi:hypothetical protein
MANPGGGADGVLPAPAHKEERRWSARSRVPAAGVSAERLPAASPSGRGTWQNVASGVTRCQRLPVCSFAFGQLMTIFGLVTGGAPQGITRRRLRV